MPKYTEFNTILSDFKRGPLKTILTLIFILIVYIASSYIKIYFVSLNHKPVDKSINLENTNFYGSPILNTGNINIGNPPRMLNEVHKNDLLKLSKNKKITIEAIMGDIDALDFANQILVFLKKEGYSVDEDISYSVYDLPQYGESISITSDGNYLIIVGSNIK